eukprot:957070-Prorocentrum_minimum.AAC.1
MCSSALDGGPLSLRPPSVSGVGGFAAALLTRPASLFQNTSLANYGTVSASVAVSDAQEVLPPPPDLVQGAGGPPPPPLRPEPRSDADEMGLATILGLVAAAAVGNNTPS